MVNTRSRPAPEYFLTKDSALELYAAALDKEDFNEIGRLYKLFRNAIRTYPPLSYVSAPKPPIQNSCAEISTKIFVMIDVIFSTIDQLPWSEAPPDVRSVHDEGDEAMASVMASLGADSDDDEDGQVRVTGAQGGNRSGFAMSNQSDIDGVEGDDGLSGPLLSPTIGGREDSVRGSGLSGPPLTVSVDRHQVSQISEGGLCRTPDMRNTGHVGAPHVSPDDRHVGAPHVSPDDRHVGAPHVSPDDRHVGAPHVSPDDRHVGAPHVLPDNRHVGAPHVLSDERHVGAPHVFAQDRHVGYPHGLDNDRHGGDPHVNRDVNNEIPKVRLASTRMEGGGRRSSGFARFTPSPIARGAQSDNTRTAVEEMSMMMSQAFQQVMQQSTQQQAEVTLAGSGFERFDGSRPGDFKSWLFGLENRLKLTKTQVDEVKVGHLVNCLSGLARRQFHEDLQRPTYQEAVVYLKEKYTDTKYNALKFQQFRSRIQRRGETIQTFARELKLAFPFGHADQQQQNLMLMEQLQRGVLDQEYKLYIQEHLLNPKKSFDGVVEKLSLRELAKETADGKPKQPDRPRERGRETFNAHYCFRCRRKTDHIGEKCPFRPATDTSRQQATSTPSYEDQKYTPKQPNRPQTNNSTVQCYKCQGYGHYASTCTAPRSPGTRANQQPAKKSVYAGRRQHKYQDRTHNCACSQQSEGLGQEAGQQLTLTPTNDSDESKRETALVADESREPKKVIIDSMTSSSVKRINIVRLPAVQQKSKEPFITVDGKEVSAARLLPDTGAELDLTTKSFLREVGYDKPLSECDHPLMGIADTPIICYGVCSLEVKIGKQKANMQFHVIESDSITDVILGQPTLKRFGFRLLNSEGIELRSPPGTQKVQENRRGVKRIAKAVSKLPLKEDDQEALFLFGDQTGTPTAGALLPLRVEDGDDETSGDMSCELPEPQSTDSSEDEFLKNVKVGNSFGDEAKTDIQKVLLNAKGAFSSAYRVGERQNIDNLGCIPGVFHHIDTGDAPPFKALERRLPLAHREMVAKMVTELLEQGVIEESSSQYSSCIVLVRKSDGSWRFCIDFRPLNSITKRDLFPMPRVEDLLDCMGNAKVFSSCDVKAGYFHIRVAPADKEKTAFVCLGRLYQFVRMPFGLRNAPATFCRSMTTILQPFIGRFAGVYIDDLIVYSDSVDDHMTHLEQILKKLEENGIKLNVNKCHFLQKEVKYLGSIISEGTIRVDPSKAEAVRKFPRPKVKRSMQEFIGMVNYYRRHHINLSTRLAPLQDLIKGLPCSNSEISWTDEASAIFDRLKEELGSPPLLSMPTVGHPYLLTCDASSIGFGAVLQQAFDERIATIGFGSRKTSGPESRYSATELEMRGLVFAVQSFRAYILGEEVVCRTDHRALIGLLKAKQPSAKLFRWALILQEYHLKVEYQPGKTNVIADALSRAPLIAAMRLSETQKMELLKEHHCSGLAAAHAGVDATTHKLRDLYQTTWPGLRQDVKKFIQQCNVCQRRNARYEILPLSPRPPPMSPRRVWFVDFTEIRKSSRFPYALVMIDSFSRWMIVIHTNSQCGQTVIKGFHKILLNFGCPEEICSDNGKHFTCKIVEEFLVSRGIKHELCTPYAKTTVGLVERANRTIQTVLAKKLDEKQLNRNMWYTILEEAVLAYNVTPHSSLGYKSPYEVVYGTKYNARNTEIDSDPHLAALWSEVRECIVKAQEEHKKTVTPDRAVTRFQVNDRVFVRKPSDMNQRMTKIDSPNSEEARILSVGRKSAEIRVEGGGRTRLVPLNWLQPRF